MSAGAAPIGWVLGLVPAPSPLRWAPGAHVQVSEAGNPPLGLRPAPLGISGGGFLEGAGDPRGLPAASPGPPAPEAFPRSHPPAQLSGRALGPLNGGRGLRAPTLSRSAPTHSHPHGSGVQRHAGGAPGPAGPLSEGLGHPQGLACPRALPPRALGAPAGLGPLWRCGEGPRVPPDPFLPPAPSRQHRGLGPTLL